MWKKICNINLSHHQCHRMSWWKRWWQEHRCWLVTPSTLNAADFSICIQATGTRNLDFQCVASFDRFERRYRKINLTEYILDVKPSGGRYHISMAQNTFVQHIQLATEQNTSQITLMSILSRLLFLDIPSSNPAQHFYPNIFISDNLLFSNITMALPSDK